MASKFRATENPSAEYSATQNQTVPEPDRIYARSLWRTTHLCRRETRLSVLARLPFRRTRGVCAPDQEFPVRFPGCGSAGTLCQAVDFGVRRSDSRLQTASREGGDVGLRLPSTAAAEHELQLCHSASRRFRARPTSAASNAQRRQWRSLDPTNKRPRTTPRGRRSILFAGKPAPARHAENGNSRVLLLQRRHARMELLLLKRYIQQPAQVF